MADRTDRERLEDIRWEDASIRGRHGALVVPPLFAAQQGPAVHIIDVRPPDAATGVMGSIPGSSFIAPDRIEELVRDAARGLPIFLVCGDGEEASRIALRLEEAGMHRTRAIAGGLAAWRAVGLGTTRDPVVASSELPNLAVTASEESVTLTLEQIRDHIGDPSAVRWIKLTSLVAHERFSCVDGRDERSVVGTPGGDAGEFLLMLAAVEQTTGNELDEASVQAALLANLDSFGAFYLHTDQHAFDVLIEALKADSRLTAFVASLETMEDWVAFLRSPSEGAQETLIEHMTNPAHLGCGHLRLMLQHSDDYGIRHDLVLSFLRSFCRLWWAGAPELNLTLLPGGHREGGVVNVRLAEPIWGLSRIPLVSPACAGKQIFLNHHDVSANLRQVVVQYHTRRLGGLALGDVKASDLEAAFNDLADRQINRTLIELAEGLPVYDVEFGRDGTFVVNEAGIIGG